jgi:hypothetical protein
MMDAVGPGTCLGVAVVKVKEIRYNIMTLRQATRQLKSLQRLVILSVEQCDVHRRHGHVRLVVRGQNAWWPVLMTCCTDQCLNRFDSCTYCFKQCRCLQRLSRPSSGGSGL